MNALQALALSKAYTKETIEGKGAIKGKDGKNCKIKSIEKIGNQNKITFEWTNDDGTTRTDYILVDDGLDGADGKSAYQIAVSLGYVGTEQEWIDSLKSDNAPQIDDTSTTATDKVWSAKKVNDSLVDIKDELGIENIPKLINFNDAIPEVGKTKVYYVNSLIGFGSVAQWRVESTLYDVTGNNNFRGYQRATSIDGVNVAEAIRPFYIDDSSRELKFGAWQQLVTK